MAHVAPWKREVVTSLEAQMRRAHVVGLVDIGGIPATQMTQMRAGLRGKATLRVTRTSLLRRVLEELQEELPEVAGLTDHLGHRQVGLILSDDNPFKLYLQLEQTKTAAPAKGGETAPADIVVPKGPTAFKAGPIVGDFQQAGFPAAIEKGKITIRKEHVAVKAGQTIPVNVAQALTKLEIFPLTVGMDLLGAWSEGTLFAKQTLALDPAQFYSELQQAIRGAQNLALNAAIAVPGVMPQLIAKAHREALNLALEAGVVNPATVERFLGRAHQQMLGLAARLAPEALDEELAGDLSRQAAAPAIGTPEPEAVPEPEEAKEEEPEQVSEEDAMAGLNSLFG